MSDVARQIQIQVNMLEAIARLTEEVRRLQQRVEALECLMPGPMTEEDVNALKRWFNQHDNGHGVAPIADRRSERAGEEPPTPIPRCGGCWSEHCTYCGVR